MSPNRHPFVVPFETALGCRSYVLIEWPYTTAAAILAAAYNDLTSQGLDRFVMFDPIPLSEFLRREAEA